MWTNRTVLGGVISLASNPSQRATVGTSPVFLGSSEGCDLVAPGLPPLAVEFTATERGIAARAVGEDGRLVSVFRNQDGESDVLGRCPVRWSLGKPTPVLTSPDFASPSNNLVVVQHRIALERAVREGGDILVLTRPDLDTPITLSLLRGHTKACAEIEIQEPWRSFDQWIMHLDRDADIILHDAAMLSASQQERLLDALQARTSPRRSRLILVWYSSIFDGVNRGHFSPYLFHVLRQNLIRIAPYKERPEDVERMLEDSARAFGVDSFRNRVSGAEWDAICREDWPRDMASVALVVQIVAVLDESGPIDLRRAYAIHVDLLFGTEGKSAFRVDRARAVLAALYKRAGHDLGSLSTALATSQRAVRSALVHYGLLGGPARGN